MERVTSPTAVIVWSALLIAGLALGWNMGRLPDREMATMDGPVTQGLAPDLALYSEVIADVRSGRDYYDSAREHIPQNGFPIASPLNWRLPTYAWLLSRLPCCGWIQLTLIALSVAALGLAFAAQSRHHGVGLAAVSTFFLFGVVRWSIDGHAYLAQEPWSATLILISLSAYARGEPRSDLATDETRTNTDTASSVFHPCPSVAQCLVWRTLAVTAGIAALFFRELALPYCLVACAFAGWNRRWLEAVTWAGGIGLFFAFFAWHVSQVQAQLAGTALAASSSLAQWLRFGGLDFVLLTTRMNSLLFAAPGCLLWAYVLVGLIGLAQSRNESSRLACLATLLYLMAFAVVGRPENFYWGLMPAPLLAWGVGGAINVLRSFLAHERVGVVQHQVASTN